MKENGLFSPKQYGFISGHSTVLPRIKVLGNWTLGLDIAIENVQGRATKELPGMCNLTYTGLNSLKLPSLAHGCLRGGMIEVFLNYAQFI